MTRLSLFDVLVGVQVKGKNHYAHSLTQNTFLPSVLLVLI